MKSLKHVIFLLSFISVSFSQYYSVELENTGVSQLTIFQNSITSLEVGDEIGIFDENAISNSGDCSSQTAELLVGTGTWEGEQVEIVSVGSIDNCAFGGFQLPGFQDGGALKLKVYRPSTGTEYAATAAYSAGTGTFGDLFMAVSELELESLEPVCEDDNDATAGFGGCAGAVAALGCDFVFGGSPISDLCPETCEQCEEEEPVCEDDNDATAGFGGCAGAAAALGCDFVFGGSPISELCPETCGECGDEEVAGCTDDSACNYDSDATVDDGSCDYAEQNFDCDGNCIVEVDCAGDCGGSAELDECSVCNGDNSSCLGCTDEEASNYDENATIDDGTCEYPNPMPEDFLFNQSTQQAFYFIIDATFEGEPLEIGEDWLAIYNDDVCVGARLWNGAYTDIPAMGDDGSDYTQGYMGPGDNPSFKVYDASSGEIYNADVTSQDSLAWSNNGFYYIEILNGVLISTTSYSLDLHYGANLVSFYALPEDASLENMMASLDGYVTGVIGEGVAASPNPVLGWVGSLDEINPLSGYWVIVNSSSSLDIADALYTDPGSVYDLHYGANLISFPSESPVQLGDALQGDFVSSIDGIIGEGIAATLNPVLGWVGSLNQFEGGDGYWLKVSEAISFSFNIDGGRLSHNNEVLEIDDNFSFNQSSRQAFYFIESISDNISISNDDYILAYNNNVLVGSRKWNGAYTDIPVMGYDGNSYSSGYCEIGDIPSIKLYKSSTGQIIDLVADIPSFENNQIYMLSNLGIDIASETPLSFGIVKNYPNPFNPSTTIDFNLDMDSNVMLAVYDINGKLVKEIKNEYLNSGNYSIQWNGLNNQGLEVSSGTYICKLIAGQYSDQIKLLLIK